MTCYLYGVSLVYSAMLIINKSPFINIQHKDGEGPIVSFQEKHLNLLSVG